MPGLQAGLMIGGLLQQLLGTGLHGAQLLRMLGLQQPGAAPGTMGAGEALPAGYRKLLGRGDTEVGARALQDILQRVPYASLAVKELELGQEALTGPLRRLAQRALTSATEGPLGMAARAAAQEIGLGLQPSAATKAMLDALATPGGTEAITQATYDRLAAQAAEQSRQTAMAQAAALRDRAAAQGLSGEAMAALGAQTSSAEAERTSQALSALAIQRELENYAARERLLSELSRSEAADREYYGNLLRSAGALGEMQHDALSRALADLGATYQPPPLASLASLGQGHFYTMNDLLSQSTQGLANVLGTMGTNWIGTAQQIADREAMLNAARRMGRYSLLGGLTGGLGHLGGGIAAGW